MQNMIINYSKREYDRRISVLEDDIKKLDSHKNELLSLAEQIKTIWRDENGLKFYNYITQRLHSIEQEKKSAESLLANYKNVSAKMGNLGETFSETFSMVTDVISGVVSSGGSGE